MLEYIWIEYRAPFQYVILVIVTVWALVKGAGPEKAAGGTLLALWLADRILHFFAGPMKVTGDMPVPHAIFDFIALGAFLVLALLANRMYPLWLAALQLLAMNAHFVRELSDAVSPLAYAILYIAPSYIQIGVIAGGVYYHRKRLAKFGPYRSWRTQRAPLQVSTQPPTQPPDKTAYD